MKRSISGNERMDCFASLGMTAENTSEKASAWDRGLCDATG